MDEFVKQLRNGMGYLWRPGMEFRWFMATRLHRKSGLRHIVRRTDVAGYFEGLCGNYIQARLTEGHEGNPCKKCLQRAEQFKLYKSEMAPTD